MWLVFGALFVGELFTHALSVQPIIYALLSLTVVRMVPVALAVIGTRLRPVTVVFMGWFGPRGLASVVFTLLALEEIVVAMVVAVSGPPSPGPSCAPWCCTAFRRHRWPPSTGAMSRSWEMSRRRHWSVSRGSGSATWPADHRPEAQQGASVQRH